MRPLWFEFPEVAATFSVDDEFLLGPALLVVRPLRQFVWFIRYLLTLAKQQGYRHRLQNGSLAVWNVWTCSTVVRLPDIGDKDSIVSSETAAHQFEEALRRHQ